MKTRKFLLASTLLLATSLSYAEQPTEITVYRSPTCSCCEKWLAHLKQNNFVIKDVVTSDMDVIKGQQGVPENLASCHTAVVNGYVVEGHVPAEDIQAMLKNKPAIKGIAVPAMPMGTPGMEMGGKKDAYDVVSFDKDNRVQVVHSYKAE